MTSPMPGQGPFQAGCIVRRGKRVLFSACLLVLLYVSTEIISFLAGLVLCQDLAWLGRLQAERDELQRVLEERAGVLLQVHPYVGYVEAPPTAKGGDAQGRQCLYPVTPYGYADTVSPIQTRAPGRVIIAVTGGSVAWSFHMHGTARLRSLLQQDPAIAGREVVFVNLAVSGYKQPQQLMTLAYMLVLGAQYDIVLNIDGFNEAALYEAENEGRHVFPAFPRSWHTRIEVDGPRIDRFRGLVEYQVERRVALARGFSRLPWRVSPLANLAWWIADARADTAIHEIEQSYRKAAPLDHEYAVEGPGWRFASRQELHRHLAALWKKSSQQLDKLCAANGVRYYHFLQPNLLVPGAKPLTGPEQQMAAHRDNMYRPGVTGTYPLMIAAGSELGAHGERFSDLTRIFASHPESIYVDLCHLNQAGNNLLAERIAEAILHDEPTPERAPGAKTSRPSGLSHIK